MLSLPVKWESENKKKLFYFSPLFTFSESVKQILCNNVLYIIMIFKVMILILAGTGQYKSVAVKDYSELNGIHTNLVQLSQFSSVNSLCLKELTNFIQYCRPWYFMYQGIAENRIFL